ncbi:hypothetical protein AXF42_Ash013401 [Apostasia shenzhenica]|uniref:Uncharacterized protein n=1 Tax=Apostasia shenzhenica TaxID=1088818 RepID=A0A2I0A441_9ASPA|nr:hypothetical protein AXF42_Ash013401 [Apostasia shenzhenica]
MPYSVFKKLCLGEAKPITVSLQLADRSIKYPRGVVEDILVKVDKFIFSVDFVVLDMEENFKAPLILDRPFLAIERTLINIQKGELILTVNNDQVKFNVFNAMKHSYNDDECFYVDVVDELVNKYFPVTLYKHCAIKRF